MANPRSPASNMKELDQNKQNTTWSSRHNTENRRSKVYNKFTYKEEIIFTEQDIAHSKEDLNQKKNNS